MIRIKQLLVDERGTSVVELALSVPLICFVLLGSVDLAMGFSERLALQQAATRTMEMATIRGMVNSSYDYLQSEAAAASGEPASNVTVDSWLACDDVRQSAYDGACGVSEQTARYVSIRINGTYDSFLNFSGLARQFGGYSPSSSVAISGKAAVRVQ